ncbi:MAG: DUF2333 family protein [Kordiimonadaceae bacterium]|nr:DUF2333 family protein [Kordiimonadaceae bacterium]MBO6568404.1 DUF2333 family protein [Kordiimonadaceae bacterium]MBO6963867.1 DUF2333 family protein [Kordiimonadaceae bacterium]
MAKEIWLWIKEKLGALFGWFGDGLLGLWRYIAGWLRTVSGSTWRKVAVGTPLAFFVYILIGMPIVNRIDDSLAVDSVAPPGGSATVSAVTYLVRRETEHNNWTPNDPVLLPGWWLDNTPNYQKGIMGAVSRFSFELRDQLGRRRGSSSVDENLEKAASNLSIEPERWIIDMSTSFLPTKPSDQYYREALGQLDTYNAQLGTGQSVFDRRSDNLLATLDRIALDLGASSASLDTYVTDHAGGIVPDFGADDLFYQVKGQVYAYTILLKAIRKDFADVIETREIAALYDDLLKSMNAAATLDPLVVSNGAVDGILIPNHLSMQGFYLLRARTQLREVSNILLK